VSEQVDAKARLGRDAARDLAASVRRVVVAKGKRVVEFEIGPVPPDDPELLAAMLGPTGGLRAPAVRRGATLLVGFNPDAYARLF